MCITSFTSVNAKDHLLDDIVLPAEIQWSLMSKLLLYERALAERCEGNFILGILYQGDYPSSLRVKNELVDAIRKSDVKEIGGNSVVVIPIDLLQVDSLTDVFSEYEINHLYLAPMRSPNLRMILEVTSEHRILTFTSSEDFSNRGVSVGLLLHSNKPSFTVNLVSMKKEGADFSSQVLKLAKIITN